MKLTGKYLLAIVLFCSVAAGSRLTLVHVPQAERAQFAQLGIPVLRELDEGMLIAADPVQTRVLESEPWPVETLDPEFAPGEYFFVFRAGAGRYSLPGRHVWTGSRASLVRMTEAEAMRAKESGFEMARVATAAHALPLPAPESDWGPFPVDTLIAGMVQSVSLDSLMLTLRELQAFGTRYTYYRQCDSAARYLGQRFTELGLVPEYDRYLAGGQDTSWNVIATLPGQVHPESIVIACGHYDSYSVQPADAPGADDNGTGTSAVIELARVMRDYQFRWTVMFIAFSGEEQWMLGSYHWVDSVAAPQQMKIVGAYNLDMFGYTAYDSNLMYATRNSASLPLAVLAESVNAQYGIGLNLVNFLDEDCAGDNSPFWDHGLKAVFVCEDSEYGIWNGSNPYYHTTRDTVGNIRPGQLKRGTQLALGCLATLAGPVSLTGVHESSSGAQAMPKRGLPCYPNPFADFARVPGREGEQFCLYDHTGRRAGVFSGARIGVGLAPGVYFVQDPNQGQTLTRVIKTAR